MTRAKYLEEMARVHPTERWNWVSIFVNDKGDEMIGLNDVRNELHSIDGVYWDCGYHRWRVDGKNGYSEFFDERHEAIKFKWLYDLVYMREDMLTSEAFDYMREADLEFVYKRLGLTT